MPSGRLREIRLSLMNFLFEDFKTGGTDSNTAYVWGTHAMVIPSCKRKKVIQVFADYRLPTDVALEAANSSGELNIRVAPSQFVLPA